MRRVLKVFVFIVLFFCILIQVSKTVIYKSEDVFPKNYYSIPRNKTKVVFVGASNIKYSIRPMQLWEKYGIPSFILGAGRQSIPTSYYVIKESIELDHPEVIVLDCTTAIYEEKLYGLTNFHYVSDNMPLFSKNRIAMINDLVEDKEDRMQFYFPLYLYHKRWAELNTIDYSNEFLDYLFGTRVRSELTDSKESITPESNPSIEIPQVTLEYLNKIVELCKESNVELVLYTSPQFNSPKSKTEEEYNQYYNVFEKIGEYAKKNHIAFYNCFDYNVQHLDSQTDSVDGLHVNDNGAIKITDYFGELLQNEFHIGDYRLSEGYQYMWDNVDSFTKYSNEEKIKTSNAILTYLSNLKNIVNDNNYVVIIAFKDGIGEYYSDDINKKLSQLGVKEIDLKDEMSSYLAIIHGKKRIVQLREDGSRITESIHLDHQTFTVSSGIFEEESIAEISINHVNFAKNKSGINILVYSIEDHKIIHSCSFDTHKKAIPRTQ